MRWIVSIMLSMSAAVDAGDSGSEPDADSVPPPGPSMASACESEKHRQFDFWIGEWDVTANGKPAGRNRIEIRHGGCALAEHWVSTRSDFSGSSLNAYDQATDRWHQTWVDATGTLLELDGGLEDGRMVMSGSRPGEDGATVIHRITWTPNEDGSVRQHWQTSSDGNSWSTAFDGLYVRRDPEP